MTSLPSMLHVLSGLDPRFGGPVAALRGLAEAQARLGQPVHVAASWAKGDDLSLPQRLRDKGIAVHLFGPALEPKLRFHPSLLFALPRLLREMRPDVVHIHALWEEIQHRAARAAAAERIPYILRPCGMLDPWSLNQSAGLKRAMMALRVRGNLNRAAAIHYTSDAERDLAAPLALRAPTLVVPNGLDLAEFAVLPTRGDLRALLGVAEDTPIVVFLSRLHPKKGLDLLLPAFAQARSEMPPGTLLVLAGPAESAEYHAKLEAAARDLSIANAVRFLGMVKGREKLAALAGADLFVLPSHQENFGIAVVEALAAGTPVLISDQVNIHGEVSSAGVGGVVPMDQTALAEALKDWMGNPEKRRAAAAKAQEFVRARYDWNALAERWRRLYEDLSASGGEALSQARGC